MMNPLMTRFHDWIGTWRGPCVLSTGAEGVIHMSFKPLFNGDVILIETYVYDQADGANINCGVGYLTLDRDGRAVDTMYSTLLGFAMLREQPDDPDALSLAGTLADNRNMNVFMNVQQDVLTLSSRVSEGYSGVDEKPRTFTRMQRIGTYVPAEAEPE